ncbi:copper fist DNA binding domain-containing protein [Seiridium cupressi]
MPLINGQKMACEPCIRGHRSTTCNHATERVMVPVRKPGRPLNECPHPRGTDCGCARDITVAIPRKRKCECAGDKSSAPKTSITQTSAEAARAGSATPSIKEQPKEVASCCQPKARANSTASNPPAMVTTPPPVSQPPVATMNGTSGPQWNTSWNLNFGPLSPSHMGTPFQGFNAPLPQRPPQSQTIQPAQQVQMGQPLQSVLPVVPVPKKNDSDDEAEGRSSQDDTSSSATTDEPASRSSCCSTKTSSTAQFVPTPGTTSPESNASSYAGHSRSNSRSRKATRPRMERQNTPSRAGVVPQALPETASRAPFPALIHSPVAQMPIHPITAHPPACTNCGQNQPPILIYLPYGPPSHPIGYAGTGGPIYVVRQPPITMPPPPEFPRNPAVTAVTVPMGGCASDTIGLGTIHECNCGPGCECIGCIAHPFNDATQEYIRSAQNAFEDFGTPYQNLSDIDPAAVPTTQSIANLSLSPEQILAPEDFFFVDYSSTQRMFPG